MLSAKRNELGRLSRALFINHKPDETRVVNRDEGCTLNLYFRKDLNLEYILAIVYECAKSRRGKPVIRSAIGTQRAERRSDSPYRHEFYL